MSLMRFVQSQRTLIAARRKASWKQSDKKDNYDKLADTWDDVHKLRTGTLAKREGHKKRKHEHPNQYRLEGFLKTGFSTTGNQRFIDRASTELHIRLQWLQLQLQLEFSYRTDAYGGDSRATGFVD